MAESVVGIVAGLLGPAKDLGELVVGPIKRWYNYLFGFYSNVQKVREEERKLKDARDGLQMRVDRAKNNAEEILPQVKTWLEKTDEVLANMVEIESEITDIQSVWLTKKFYRFSLSQKVKKTTEAMEQLLGDCNFDVISHPAPPASMVPIPLRPTYEFESRKHIEEDIMITLRDRKVNMMGICGLGGVGKTTMAKRVMNRVREEDLFDEIVMVVVSQQVDMLKIQNEIGEQLGLKWEDHISFSARAHILRTRLAGRKRILIVIDDVWKNLKLEDLGIPCESDFKACIILLTSRDRRVLSEMDAQKVCVVQTLSEIEAWFLFKEKVGSCVNDKNLLSIAQEVVKECKGLPIAIVNVAAALKDVKYKFIWDDALEQLKSSDPIDMPKVLEYVYKPLKISYDFLGNQHAKSIFLLCCLFPEDDNIPLEDLTMYAMGLSMFERIRNLEQVRNRTYSLVEMLKSRFLLLEGRDQNYVRMHDVVRDVAIFIASEERHIKCGDCTWISLYLEEGIELSSELIFPNLRLLMAETLGDKEVQLNDNLFEGMTKLNVLSVSYYSLRSLPRSTQLLKNLRTLTLFFCEDLETISNVGELVNLEILICRYCHSIKELPVEIGRLDRMRLLKLSNCMELKTIAPGIISRLVRLETLKIVKSFKKWEAEDNEGRQRMNAGLQELESLSNLTCLKIEVEDFALAAGQIRLASNIVKFDITIDGCQFNKYMSPKGSKNKIHLRLPREITLGNWILRLWSSVEHMTLLGEGLSNLELKQDLQNLRSLTLGEYSMVKNLGNVVFPLLEYLELHNLCNLEEICVIDGPISDDEGFTFNNAFKNLKELRLSRLRALKHLCKNNIGAKSCHGRYIKIFPKLEKLTLLELPSLTTFCKGIESIKFPLLTEMEIWACPKLMKSHVSTTCSIGCVNNTKTSKGNSHDHDDDDDEDDSLHLFCKPEEVVFGRISWLLWRSSKDVKALLGIKSRSPKTRKKNELFTWYKYSNVMVPSDSN